MKKLSWTSAGDSNSKTILVLATVLLLTLSCFAQEKLKVVDVLFEGNASIPAEEFKRVIKSRKGLEFNQRVHRVDRTLLTNYYQLRGFLKVFVEVEYRKEGDKIFVVFLISEGVRSYLKEIVFFGNESVDENTIRGMFAIKNGDVFRRTAIDNGLNTLEQYHLNNGRPYVVLTDREDVESDSLVTVQIYIHEDDKVVIEKIRYTGLDKAKRFLLRREMDIEEGEFYSRTAINRSQSNIYSTGLFELVNFRLAPIEDDRSRVALTWQLTEKKVRWTGLRFGVSHEDAQSDVITFDFTLEGGHRNLFGTARSISMRAVPSIYYGRVQEGGNRRLLNPRNEYTFTFTEPWVFNTRTPGQFSVSYAQQAQPVATRELTTFSTSWKLSHKFRNNWYYTGGIGFERVKTASDTLRIQIASGQDLIYSIYIDPVKDQRDNVLNPRRGYLTELRNKFVFSTSPDSVDGEEVKIRNTFYKAKFQWARYQKFALYKPWVLATRIGFGGIIGLGDSRPVTQIPITERFYVGGASSVRGYVENGIGDSVTDGDGNEVPIGGKTELVANAELRMPLFWLFYGEVFIDAGNVWKSWESMQKNFSLKAGSGAGLVVVTPFGPIRFDYGVKLFPEQGESFGEFHIGIAFAF
ncbi:MAG: BamA/OMP85 family outer membrane protein [Calditrichia bacterium]